MNSRPIALRLASGSVSPARTAAKRSAAFDVHEIDAGGGHEVLLDLLRLALAQQTVVDEDARQLVPDGLVHHCGGDRGVHPTGQAAQNPAVPDLPADLLDRFVHDVDHRPGGSARARTGSA